MLTTLLIIVSISTAAFAGVAIDSAAKARRRARQAETERDQARLDAYDAFASTRDDLPRSPFARKRSRPRK